MDFLSKSGIAGCNGSSFVNFFDEVPYCVFIVTASVYILCGVFEGYMNPKTFLKPSLTQVALLGKWWTMGSKVWTLMNLSLLFLWSSDSKMSTALSVVMHFPRSLRKQKTKVKKTSIFSLGLRKLARRIKPKVHPTSDSVEGTVEIHSLSWFKNNYSRGTWVVSNSWFWPRSWCQGHEIEPRVGLHAGYGACFRFSLPFPMPLLCSHSLFVSKRKKKKKNHYTSFQCPILKTKMPSHIIFVSRVTILI